MRTKMAVLWLIPMVVGCGSTVHGPAGPSATASQIENPAARRGLAFAQSHCVTCHAIDAGVSPRPETPSFETIANTSGLTDDTLKFWLRDSHNYPEIMNFTIESGQIDDLAAYMLTLKNPAYTPPIQ